MKAPRERLLRIETPEGVVFSFPLATGAARALAWAIDAAAIGAASSAVSQACLKLRVLSPDWANAVGVMLYFAASVGYAILLEWRWRGQTLGKRVVGLRVMDARGLRLRLAQVVLRNLLRFLDMLPALYLVGGAASFLSRYGQRIGDVAANTVVVRDSVPPPPDLDRIAPARYNSLMDYPHLVVRLRGLARPEAVAAAVEALTLRDGYEPEARVRLFGELAAYFHGLARFPDEALESLTDEQFVRSVVRAVYSGR
jgi:uncharacterized RDD family membrane protein YckC